MIYETEIKIKNIIVSIEFDTETEEFSYQIKERKQANAKNQSKETGNTNRNTNENTDGNTNKDTNRVTNNEDEFEQFFKWNWIR